MGPTPNWLCPPPLAWTQGGERPVRLRLTNNHEVPILVFLDQCDGHTRLGDLNPGATRRLRLPTRLIPFNDQLRVHVFDKEAREGVGIYAVDVESRWELDLVVDPETPEVTRVYSEGTSPVQRIRRGAGFMTYPGEGLSYASRWAEDTPAALTWQCSSAGAQITLTHVGSADESHRVTVEFEGGEGRESGSWALLNGLTRSLLAPPEDVTAITEGALGAETLLIKVGLGREEIRHRFGVDGLAEALRYLPCFSESGE